MVSLRKFVICAFFIEDLENRRCIALSGTLVLMLVVCFPMMAGIVALWMAFIFLLSPN